MSKDRPWNRSPESEPAGQPEPAHIVPPLAGLEIHGMNDEQVRAHCLRQARYWLASYEHLRRRNDEHLETATRYAVLADAFRPGSTPTEQ
ncbi:hypothetical protein OHU34_06045 [Streptomyces sp. NBC_00080]|uniref:hypothetical protein n=1 Tax=unclassified Streptomyces TaxID=2593676 RepID=UPI0011541BF4|nr:hypothetical protein [Streptomyces sp. SLBN-115]TQJ57292.1 hypothetical protein FBY34_5140 [Streptomyces sp. SLBN-115]